MWFLGYIKSGKTKQRGAKFREYNEFIVQKTLNDLNIKNWVARKIEFKRMGKSRRPEPTEMPYLPNYIFIYLEEIQISQIGSVDLLSNTLYRLNKADEGAFETFRRGVECEYSIDARRRSNGAVRTEFKEGELLKAIGGQFEDHLLKFKRLVERSYDYHPKIEAEVELFGQSVKILMDPLDVKKA